MTPELEIMIDKSRNMPPMTEAEYQEHGHLEVPKVWMHTAKPVWDFAGLVTVCVTTIIVVYIVFT